VERGQLRAESGEREEERRERTGEWRLDFFSLAPVSPLCVYHVDSMLLLNFTQKQIYKWFI
jgi:hypothetical protein